MDRPIDVVIAAHCDDGARWVVIAVGVSVRVPQRRLGVTSISWLAMVVGDAPFDSQPLGSY